MKANNKWDIKCDNCGKFISSKELSKDGGASQCFIPDSDVSYEEFRFRCKKCTELLGRIKSLQYGMSESTSWVN